MNKIILKKTTNAIFLAVVLIAGTFAAISPTFIIGVNAQSESFNYGYNSYEQESYGKDKDKSKDSNSVSIKKLKCNNINVNINGFNGVEVGTLPTALTGLATDEAQASDEGEVGASSSGSGGSDGRPSSAQASDKWCINHNEFVVIDRGGGTTPEPETCEECFEAFSISRPD